MPRKSKGRAPSEKCAALIKLLDEEGAPPTQQAPYHLRMALQVRKWDVIYQHLQEHPFQVSQALPRSEQWQWVLEYIKTTLAERELIDWLMQQIHIATNLVTGVRDHHPRRNGLCYELLVSHVSRRRHKARAVYKGALKEIEGQASDIVS